MPNRWQGTSNTFPELNKQTNINDRTSSVTTSLPRKGHYRNTMAQDDGRDLDDYTGTRRRQ